MPEPLDRLKSALAGRYALERELGRGGMATVYLAQDLKHKRRVAIKVVRPELAAVLGPERFLREIEITAQLNHPHILPLLDSGEADGFLFYAMPYAEGESLRERLNREKQLPIEDTLRIAREVADALYYAHKHDVVHRDIKPENILLEGDHAVVADFGIGRAVSVAGGEKITATGVAVGTPEYMSPEQAGAREEVDGRSDTYALGCVVHEMLVGQPPFTGATVEAVLRQHLTANPPAVTAIRAGVPTAVARAIQRCLAKSPADRFATAVEFARALASSARPGIAAPRPVRLARSLALGLATALVLGAAWWALRGAHVGLRGPAFPRTAVAVLPFQNLSAEEQHAYFTGGLHDEILTQLSKVAALKVISGTSVMGYAGPNIPSLRQIAGELGVGSVVEGSVQVIGGRLRVNVQLIDAATDAHLWADRYDRTLNDAFAIQSDIAQQIVTAVGTALSAAERQAVAEAPTANAEAYQLYLQGREYATRSGRDPQNLQIAQQFYERALALDPGFALARAMLSDAHGVIFHFYERSPARLARQREEAEAALRLAPNLAQAHFAMGHAHYESGDHQRALDEYALALKGMPNDGELWLFIAAVHRALGNGDDAVAVFQKASQLDPRNPDLFFEGATTFRLLARYPEAIRAYDRALSLAPDLHDAAVAKGLVYVMWQGQLDTLRAVLNRLPSVALRANGGIQARLLLWERRADSLLRFARAIDAPPRSLLHAAWAHRLRGDSLAARVAFDSARVILDSLIGTGNQPFLRAMRGLALAGLGRREEARQDAGSLRQQSLGPSLFRSQPREDVARILAQVGDADAALEVIEQLLVGPTWLTSVHTLRLDPLWDPIRNHPRFQALLAKYDQPSRD